MENYKNASEVGQDLILSYLKNRMKEKKVSQDKLAEILQIGVTTLWRYFKKETPMPLGVYLEICGALDLRPYLIPSEDDEIQMTNRINFN
jgi:transcriptional regulator with XRE-family HTH domain